MPRLALAVCTRDRPLQLRRCLDSLARQPLALVSDIVVIDQSSTSEPERVVASHALASRIRYAPQPGTGVSRARNLAVTMLDQAEIIVFIDDDCTAEPGWLAAMVAPLEEPRVALVYGSVRPIAHDHDDGYIGGWSPPRPRVLRGRLGKLHDAGAMGASRALRASVARTLRFDEMLGPGAPLHAAEDMDFSYRLLKAGWWIAHAPDATVLHWGFRGLREGSRLMYEVSGGIAATYVKQIQGGDLIAPILYAHELWRAVRNLLGRMVTLQRPFGFRRVAGFLVGTAVAACTPSDPRTGLYRRPRIDASRERPLAASATQTGTHH